MGECASRRKRSIAVEDFAEGADTARLEMVGERDKELAGDRRIVVDLEMGLDEGADEPSPGSALVVAAVSFDAIAAVGANIVWVGWGERSQSIGRQ